VVELGQATPKSSALPDTVTALPGVPLVMGTTTPSFEEFTPTASQVVELVQATPKRFALPDTAWVVTLADAGVLATASPTSAPDTAKRTLTSRRTRTKRNRVVERRAIDEPLVS